MKTISLYFNDQLVFDYEKESLEEQQLSFLDKMDNDMDRGIKIKGELISKPDSKQRATFVSLNLLRALQQENESIISASCAYLSSRLPLLVEVRAAKQDDGVNISLVEEH